MLRYALPLLGLLMLPSAQAQSAEAKDAPVAKPATPADKSVGGPSAQPVVSAVDAKAAEDAATAYLNALKAQGFTAAPAYLHPDAMARFKALVMPALKDEQSRGTRTLLNVTFGREASYATAMAADPKDFLARFSRLISAREPDAVPRFSSLTPIGVMPEGEQLHVLVRLNQGSSAGGAGSEPIERIEVVSLRPQGKDWKVMLDSRLQDLGRSLAGRTRTDDRRGAPMRMEPLPEGLAPTPGTPQGPAGLPPLPGPSGLPPAPTR